MNLRQQAASGAKWTTASMIVTSAVFFLQLSILTRLLSSKDFGLMAMIMVVLGFAQAYSDMGISNAIIYRQNATKEQLSSLYWTNILAGVIVFFLVLLATPFITKFYNEPRLSSLLPWASIIFLIIPIGQQYQILLQKELLFRPLALTEIAGSLAGFTAAVFSACQGLEVFSLILGQIANCTIKSLFFSIIGFRRWRPHFHLKMKDLKGYLLFGFYQMGEKSINYLSANLDYIMIGRFLGADILGFYTLAYQMIIFPLQKINPIINKIVFPVFAIVKEDEKVLRKGFLEVTKLLSYVSFPLLTGLAVTAPLVIPFLFGSGWHPSILLIQILALVGILKVLGNPNGSILLAKGRVDIGFKWNIFVAISNSLFFYFAAQHSVYHVAWIYLISSIIYFYFFKNIMNHIINVPWIVYFKAMVWPLLFSFVMGALVFFINILRTPLTDTTTVIIQISFGCFIYLSMIIIFQKKYFFSILKLFLQRGF